MAPRTSSRDRMTIRSRKASAGKPDNGSGDVQAMPPTSPISIPPTPRATQISPHKRELPTDAPAVQMSNPMPPPAIPRRLSFGSVDEVEVIKESQLVNVSATPDEEVSFGECEPVLADLDMEDQAAVTQVKKGVGKHKHESPTPSPSPASTVKALKRPSAVALKAKGRIQASPAKRPRPTTRLDSDDESVVVISYDSGTNDVAKELSESEVDELLPDTPRPTLIEQSLVLSMLNVEVEEDNDGGDKGEAEGQEEGDIAAAWDEPSPPPTRLVKVVSKGKAKAEPKPISFASLSSRRRPATAYKSKVLAGKPAPPPVVATVGSSSAGIFPSARSKGTIGGIEDPIFLMSSDDEDFKGPPAVKNVAQTGRTPSSALKGQPAKMRGPAIRAAAVATKALAKVFGSGGDGGEPDPGNGNTAFENSSNGEGFNATERHEELMDEIVFPGIPPLLRDIVVHLRASGITQHLCHSELCPRYTGRDDPEGRMPNILYVLARMQNEYAAVPIFDSLLFRGFANYVNPLTADP
ncbi:hypothetical protein BDN71DRAFT_1509001 [Pleurotus eryngii]|uniref:Uncharacterized protein n=1 Tax=Pleurotus eryngii TaxID=5323 RepID=A0A9P6DE76_PLEER|nr:hypothetical protein BDN71DRAFT_1509001 [Pleurotus eryngii]